MMSQTIWICGRYFEYDGTEPGVQGYWDLLGVYTSREKALARVKNYEDFIAPAVLDEDYPEEPTPWPGIEYPLAGG